VAYFPSGPVSNIGHHAAMLQADAELVDRGKIRRFPRSGDSGFSLQCNDQNKLNNGFFDTISLAADVARNHFLAGLIEILQRAAADRQPLRRTGLAVAT
jgi:hypothetical protein